MTVLSKTVPKRKAFPETVGTLTRLNKCEDLQEGIYRNTAEHGLGLLEQQASAVPEEHQHPIQ